MAIPVRDLSQSHHDLRQSQHDLSHFFTVGALGQEEQEDEGEEHPCRGEFPPSAFPAVFPHGNQDPRDGDQEHRRTEDVGVPHPKSRGGFVEVYGVSQEGYAPLVFEGACAVFQLEVEDDIASVVYPQCAFSDAVSFVFQLGVYRLGEARYELLGDHLPIGGQADGEFLLVVGVASGVPVLSVVEDDAREGKGDEQA